MMDLEYQINLEQKFLLNSDRADTTTLLVDVFENASATGSSTFTLAEDLTVVKSDSNNYFLQESSHIEVPIDQ